MAITGLRNLCTPSYVYLVISMISIFIMFFQNIGNFDKYCVGNFTCTVTNTTLIFVIKILYVLFWTWILNLICSSGFTSISWLLLLMPIILSFLLIALLFIS